MMNCDIQTLFHEKLVRVDFHEVYFHKVHFGCYIQCLAT